MAMCATTLAAIITANKMTKGMFSSDLELVKESQMISKAEFFCKEKASVIYCNHNGKVR